ncbi:MAG: hypothetical protein HN820_07185 [Candidatus Marinimicrobia bacterium]|nr:hypothetical protein [Candidatus Neomarinimicrobiota bacterium]MBT7377925.1 hypothetical protein [Candidatus Neomarinimicrobiota bacterium]
MKETLNQLIELQEIDCRLYEINELKGDLPEKVLDQENELNVYKNENETKDARVQEIEHTSRKHNAEVEDFNVKLTKYKDQLYLVTSNKEYDALNTEIDSMKKAISESETIILTEEEEKNTLNEAIKSNSNKIETVTLTLEEDKSELKTALSKTQAEEKKLIKNRTGLVKGIDSRYLSTYERLMGARDGAGMVSMTKSACGSCYTKLPPQMIIEVKENSKIISCPSCSIFLFWDGIEE